MLFFSLLLAFIAIAYSAYTADEILSLPGWSGALPSKQYSGYLDLESGTHLHYWLVTSEQNPSTDPTVLWFNGGPGCSSLDGFVYEHGPFEFNSDATQLSTRPYRWNRIANVLYIEAPVGVGFSYSSTNDYKCNDERTANDNLLAVEAFFAKFPELKANKFFITGESYAGVYVPTLAEAIVQAEAVGSYTGAKLTGIAVGNGCSGTKVGICGDGPQGTYYEWKYLTQTAFVDSHLKTAIDSTCDWAAAANNTPNALSVQCVSLLNQASGEIQNVNLYDIYGDCVNDMCSATADGEKTKRGKVPMRAEYSVTDPENPARTRRLARIIPHGPDACIDSGVASAYFNRADVQAAIHVKDPGYCWAVCNTAPGWSYKSTREDLPKNTYPLLVKNIHVTIYNGDWDACVPYTDGEGWTESLNLPVKTAWHAWKYTSASGNADQVAGYAVEYNIGAAGDDDTSSSSFRFITVKGGRHEVPESAPAQALELLTRVINGQTF